MRTQLEIERRLKIPRGFEPLGSTVDIERESISRASEHFFRNRFCFSFRDGKR